MTIAPPRPITFTIVDVGHGSCVAVCGGGSLSLIDAGPGAAVLAYLERENVREVHTVVISHADADHLGGLIALLSQPDFTVRRVLLNSDAAKRSDIWHDLVYTLDDRKRRGEIEVIIGIVEGDVIDIGVSGSFLRAVGPRARLSLLGPGSIDRDGRKITSNTISAVLQLEIEGRAVLLLPGDLDAVGFSHIESAGALGPADYLLVPHHGGRCGTEAQTEEVIRKLCSVVNPREVLISSGRGRFGTPRPEVIREIRSAVPTARIACTQLSERCAPDVPDAGDTRLHLLPIFAVGHERSVCCAGSVRFSGVTDVARLNDYAAHQTFIQQFAPDALCLKLADVVPGT